MSDFLCQSTPAESLPATGLHWVRCSICGQKLMQAAPRAAVHGLYIKCRRCRSVVEVAL